MIKFRDVYMGMVVKVDDSVTFEDSRYGMITGITQNHLNEPCFKVQWQDGEVNIMHPKNLEKVYDQ